jgi:hypothetical protein
VPPKKKKKKKAKYNCYTSSLTVHLNAGELSFFLAISLESFPRKCGSVR